jgi:hypothetical protein
MSSRRSARRKGVAVAVIGLFGVVAAAAGFAQISGSGDASGSTTTTIALTSTTSTVPGPTTTVDPATLAPDAKELYDLVHAGRATTYHVRFTLSGSSLTSDTTGATLEVWRSGPRIRQDTTLDDNRGHTHGANIGGPEGTITCQEQSNIPLTCQQESTAPVGSDADLLSTITQRLGSAVVVARDDVVLDRAVRCFDLDKDTAQTATSVCLTSEGVPLSLSAAGLQATATLVDAAVDDSTFVPPAPVSGTATSVVESTVITVPSGP